MHHVPFAVRALPLAAAIALASAPSFAQAPSGGPEQAGPLAEVTVTAQRVSERLQDVPLSVTALSAVELQDRQVLTGLDLARQVPNLYASNNVGLGSAASFFLRGVGQDESLPTSDPAIGVYVDGVYISRQVANNVLLYDLDRVEVLRGPQGTLYGRNTSGGAIKFVTRKPEANFGGYVDTNYEFEYNRYLIDAVVNAPFTDTLYGKLSVVNTKQQDGFIKDVTTGQDAWAPEATGVRGQLRWVPSEVADITATVEYLKDEGQEVIGQDRLFDDQGTLFKVISGLPNQFEKTETNAVTVNGLFSFGNVQLESITGYRDLDQTFYEDFSDQVIPAYKIPNAGTHRQWSQEFTLSGKAASVDWLAGVYYMDETNHVFLGDELFLFGGFIAANFMKDLQNSTESSAVFAQATWHANDRLGLTAGGRYTEEKKDVSVDQFIVIPDPGIPGVTIPDYAPSDYPGARGPLLPFWDTAAVQAAGTDTSPTFSEFDPKLGVDYKITDSAMLFVSWTQGFKSGGWNARVTDPRDFVLYEPETVDSYELGLKSQWLDNRLRANVTLFRADYNNFQITAINPATGSFITVNAAKMRNQGIEGEFAWSASDSVSLFANIGTNDAKYTESTSPAVSVSDKVKRTPEMSYALGADIHYPIGNGRLIGNVRYTHTDEYFADLANSESAHVPPVGLFDVMFGYESSDATWRATVSCKNCADEESFHSALDFGALGFATRFPNPPRQVFLNLRYNFAGSK
jgi:iron complex outermembrane receptor protein